MLWQFGRLGFRKTPLLLTFAAQFGNQVTFHPLRGHLGRLRMFESKGPKACRARRMGLFHILSLGYHPQQMLYICRQTSSVKLVRAAIKWGMMLPVLHAWNTYGPQS